MSAVSRQVLHATSPNLPMAHSVTLLYASGKYVPLLYKPAALQADRGPRTEQLTATS